MISNFMRTSYDGLKSARGTANHTIQELQARTNLEAGIDKTAVLERSVTLRFSKRDPLKDTQTEAFKWLCNHRELLSKLGRLAIDNALQEDDKFLVSIYQMALDKVPPTVKDDRVRKALAFVNFGLFMLADIMGLKEGDTDLELINSLLAMDRLEQSEGNSKSIVDLTLEEIDNAMPTIERNCIDNYNLYQLVNNGTELALNITAIYPLFTKYLKDFNVDFKPLSLREFTKQLQTSSYFVARKAVKLKLRGDLKEHGALKSEKVVKAYTLDVLKLDKLEIDSLLK